MKKNEFQISSYILKPGIIIRDLADPKLQDYFINIENIEELIVIKKKLDSDYLDGFISIKFEDKTIMGPRDWDSVTTLWAYILNLIEEVLVNKHAETLFPDQPLKFSFTSYGEQVLVVLGDRKYMLPKDAFFNSLLDGAYVFFHTYALLFGSTGDSVQYEFDKIEVLRKKLAQE